MKNSCNYPLVLLPGTGCNASLWHSVLPFLPDSVTPIMPNLFACESQQAMLEMIDELPYEKFALLGFSMGGYLAQHFYAMHPERVSHLILLCTSGEEKQMRQTQIQHSLNHLTDERYLAQMIDINRNDKQALYTRLITMLNEVGLEAIQRQMYATRYRVSVLDKFPSQPVSTLVIGASGDKLVPKVHIERLAYSLKSKVTWIDSGHMLPIEAPNKLGTVLNSWLNNVIFGRAVD